MSTANRDLSDLVQGDDRNYNLNFTDSQDNAQNITGWTVFFTLKRDPSIDDTDAAISKTITTHNDAANGETSFKITNDDSKDLKGSYYYDIQVKKDSGDIQTIVWGNINILEEYTERES